MTVLLGWLEDTTVVATFLSYQEYRILASDKVTILSKLFGVYLVDWI
ncbi:MULTISPECIES: hypothetical protein [unclassified Moraxella]|nr:MULTISPECIES: hypothetical protein [unclassified Moraxella]